MDWRHLEEILIAGKQVFAELKNLCVWNKATAGLGTFYRSKHELIFVWKMKEGKHVNNFGLGGNGRYRTNVWDYAGVSGFKKARDEELGFHPTTKPVQMIVDAIKDCSRAGDLVLDLFGGSGTTLIAAEATKRRAHLVEIDARYCDVIIQRFRSHSARRVRHEVLGLSFEQVEARRHGARKAVA
jgi:DNA modification methylase